MSTDSHFLHHFPIQTPLDILSSEATHAPLALDTSPTEPSLLEAHETFQYASCPHCRSQRARLTKATNIYKTFFILTCPYCSYSDNDVCDY